VSSHCGTLSTFVAGTVNRMGHESGREGMPQH